MTFPLLLCLATTPIPDIDPEHAANRLAFALTVEGVDMGGARVELPAFRFRDGDSAETQRKQLADLAGGDRAADDLLRDSVTAPFVLKVRDETTKTGDTIRLASLVFALRGDFAAIDPAEAARKAAGKVVEVANMRTETSILGPDAIKAAGLPPADPGREWYAHLSARLLDRIAVEATDHVVVTRSDWSIVVAARTDPRFDAPGGNSPNTWTTIDRDGKPSGGPKPFAGGASVARIGRLAGTPDTLVVEAHFALVEPRPWFDGAPILRSKFAPIAQDQIRRLRRETKSGGQPSR